MPHFYVAVQAVSDEGVSQFSNIEHFQYVNTELTLKILHINDVHSNLEASDIDLTLDGVETKCEVGGMARVAAKIKELQEENGNNLVLHAGDAVQGTLYYTLFKGEADAEVMNAIGFDAMAIGNHEFDDGDEWLAGFINRLDVPVISANIEVPSDNVLAGLYSPLRHCRSGGGNRSVSSG